MRVLVEGSGGSAGWPQPGCRCASCLRREADGNVQRSTIVVDGLVRFGIEDAEGGDAGGGDAGGGDAEGGDAGGGDAGGGDAGGGDAEGGDAGGRDAEGGDAGGRDTGRARPAIRYGHRWGMGAHCAGRGAAALPGRTGGGAGSAGRRGTL